MRYITHAMILLAGAVQLHAQQPDEWTLKGRVLDERDRPVAGARIQACLGAADGTLREAQVETLACMSGEDGRFILPLPYRDVIYNLGIRVAPTSGEYPRVMAVGDEERVFRVKTSVQSRKELSGTLVQRNGGAAANTVVELIGEYGFKQSSRTDAEGRYHFTVPDYIGQSVYLARSDGDVVRSDIFGSYSTEQPALLKLREPATIAGRVTCAGTDQPIGGATVSIRTSAMNDFRMHASTDADGRYEMIEVPAGEYLLEVKAEEYFSPPSPPPSGLEIRIGPGESKTFDLQMEPRAVVQGVVVDANGGPAAGAMVGMRVQHRDQHNRQYAITWTDEKGRFCIATSWLNSHEQLHVFHGRLGARTVDIGTPSGGERLKDVKVQLAGTMHVSGTVVDTGGRPVQGITCAPDGLANLSVETDKGGAFDLGLVPATGQGRQQYGLVFRSPRPGRGHLIWASTFSQQETTPDRTYQYKRVTFEGKPGDAVSVRAELEEAEILTIKVRVIDQAGNGVAGAAVALMAGNITDAQWVEYCPTMSPISSRIVPIQATPLAQTTTDERGAYEFKVVRENAESMALLYGANADPTRYSVCTLVSEKIHAVENDIQVPPSQHEQEVTISLEMPGRDVEAAKLDG